MLCLGYYFRSAVIDYIKTLKYKMAEAMSQEHLVQKLYQILDTLHEDIEVEKKKHQEEIDALVKCLQTKQEEITYLKTFIKQQNKSQNFQSAKKQKSAMSISAVFTRKKSTQEKPSLQIHLKNNSLKCESKLIKGVDMTRSIQSKKSRAQSGLKNTQFTRSTSGKKSEDFTKIGGQKGKSQSIDKKCYVVKKKVDIQNKQNIVPEITKNSFNFKSPTNKNTAGFTLNKKEGLKLRDSKQSHQPEDSCKKKEEIINKSQSRKQISVFIPLKRSKQMTVKKSIELKE